MSVFFYTCNVNYAISSMMMMMSFSSSYDDARR